MTLAELSVRMSYREFRAWCAWLDKKWSEPSRTDYYLMQIASFIEARGFRKQPKAAGKQRIHFERKVVNKEEGETSNQRWAPIRKKIDGTRS